MLRTQILNCRPNERGRFLWCWLGIAIGDDLNDTAIAEIINAVAYRVAKFNDGVLARRIGQVLVPSPACRTSARNRGRPGAGAVVVVAAVVGLACCPSEPPHAANSNATTTTRPKRFMAPLLALALHSVLGFLDAISSLGDVGIGRVTVTPVRELLRESVDGEDQSVTLKAVGGPDSDVF